MNLAESAIALMLSGLFLFVTADAGFQMAREMEKIEQSVQGAPDGAPSPSHSEVLRGFGGSLPARDMLERLRLGIPAGKVLPALPDADPCACSTCPACGRLRVARF